MSSVPALYRAFEIIIDIIWGEKDAIWVPETDDTNTDIEIMIMDTYATGLGEML